MATGTITANTTPTVVNPLGSGVGYVTDLTITTDYATGGIAPTFGYAYKAGAKPVLVLVNPVAGYTFDFDYTNNKLKIYTASATELAAGAVPAAITAAAIKAFVWFHKG